MARTRANNNNKRQVTVRVRNPRRVTQMRKTTVSPREVSALGQALRALGGVAGGAAGGYFGNAAIGSAAGTGLGAAVSRWLGAGDYTVQQNSVLNKLEAGSSIPAMHKQGQSITVRHKEFVGKITSSQVFTVQQTLPINPGLSGLFPWLSGIARSYEQYEIKGLVYHYVPASGTAVSGTNPALGSVMIQTSYRAGAEAPLSKAEILNEYWASSSVPSQPFAHPIECATAETPFRVHYVRNTALPATENQMMYDYGQTFVAVDGCLANGNYLGDLWVTYEIELKKPIVRSTVSTGVAQGSYLQDAIPSLVAPFGGTSTQYITNDLGAQFPEPGTIGNTIRIPPGYGGRTFQLNWTFVNAAAAAMTVAGAPTVVNAVPVNYQPSYARVEINDASTINGTYIYRFQVIDGAATTVLTMPALGAMPLTATWRMTIVDVTD